METEDVVEELQMTETEGAAKFKRSLPLPHITIRHMVSPVIRVTTPDGRTIKRGVTQKACCTISLAAGLLIKDITRKAIALAQTQRSPYVTRANIIDACLNDPTLRFAVSIIPTADLQMRVSEKNMLSSRIAEAFMEKAIKAQVPFSPPNPSGSKQAGRADENKDVENFDAICRALVRSLTAYMRSPPSFLYDNLKSKGY